MGAFSFPVSDVSLDQDHDSGPYSSWETELNQKNRHKFVKVVNHEI